jgi:hypothetical protein
MKPHKVLLTVLLTMLVLSLAVPSGAAPAGPLAQVIEGAKKQGTVSAKLHSNFTQNSMYRLEKEIKDKYGVDLKIELKVPLKIGYFCYQYSNRCVMV